MGNTMNLKMLHKSWQKYGVYHIDLHDDCVYEENIQINHYFIRYTFVSTLRANLQSNTYGVRVSCFKNKSKLGFAFASHADDRGSIPGRDRPKS